MTDKEQVDIAIIKAWAKQNLVGNSYASPIGLITITVTSIKETLNQPHKIKNEKNNAIYILPELLNESRYVMGTEDTKEKIKEYHYLKIALKEKPSYIVIKETWQGSKHLYSIVDNLKEKKNG